MAENQRYSYDLGHYSFQSGVIGSLMTMSTIPVIAGDSISINLQGILRLSPLRRNLTVDARVDLFGFYVPYRHIYGDDWITFMKEGVDEAITFPTSDAGTATVIPSYLGAPYRNLIPRWLPAGYNRIWNRYFRHPTADSDVLADTTMLSASAERLYGKPCAHLPAIWNTPIEAEVDSSDLQVSTAGDVLDLTALSQQQARLTTERRREWFSQRYNDVLMRTFGARVNIDADERPELLIRVPSWMSGYDVDGTDDASLGQYSGKAAAIVSMNMGRKFIPEHGTIWLMALVRFPPIHEDEMHFFTRVPNPTYAQLAGDPDVMAAEPPETVDLGNYFQYEASPGWLSDAGIAPFGQHYRMHPNHVHRNFDVVDGFTFLTGSFTSKATSRYVASSAYDQVFSTTQLGHWQSQCRVDVDVKRVVPPVEASIFAGT